MGHLLLHVGVPFTKVWLSNELNGTFKQQT